MSAEAACAACHEYSSHLLKDLIGGGGATHTVR